MTRAFQEAFTSGELAPEMRARIGLDQYQKGLALCRNFVVGVTGSVRNRPGLRYLARTRNDEPARLWPFQFSAVDGLLLVFTPLKMRVYKNGAEIQGVGGPYELTTAYTALDLPGLRFAQSANVLTVTYPGHPPREIRRIADDSWTITDIAFGPLPPTALASAFTLTKSLSGTGATWRYKITYENGSGEEGLPSAEKSIAAHENLDALNYVDVAITFPYPAGVTRASVYKRKGGTFGYIGTSDDGAFRDTGIAPALDETPPTARNPFASSNHPTAVGYWQQRQVFAGSNAQPDTAWLSKTGVFRNFSISEPLRDDDAITITLASQQVNRILHLVGLRALLMFTTAGVWSLKRGDRGLTPALEGGIDLETAFGCSDLPPLVVGNEALYVEAQRTRVRSVAFDASQDGYGGQEISLLSAHLLRASRARAWAWAREPFSVIWAVRDDGRLLSCSYLPEQNVLGWAWHDTDGAFEDVAVVEEDRQSTAYFVVRRRVGGQFRRFVERLALRVTDDIAGAYYVDCGISYDAPQTITGMALGATTTITFAGNPFAVGDLIDLAGVDNGPNLNEKRFRVRAIVGTTYEIENPDTGESIETAGAWLAGGVARRALAEITGLSHLEGRTVSVLADGSVDGPFVVTGGKIALTYPASRAHVGLPYVSAIETLSVAADPEAYGARKRPVRLQVHVVGTRGIEVGPDASRLDEVKQRSDERMGEPTRTVDGAIVTTIGSSWGQSGKVHVRQALPLPCEIIAISPEFQVGG